jgi:hypothetical protein
VSRTASLPLLAALALTAAAPGCKKDLGLPIGSQLLCADGRCPEGWTCNATLHQCIRNDAIDSVAPALRAPATASPRDVPLGVTVRLAFDATEDLLRTPVVHLDAGTPRTLALDAAASAGRHWEFTYAVAGDEPQAVPCPVTIDLVDRQGLLANGLSGGSLRFDFAPPTLSGPSVSGSPVPPGGTVQVRFTASEPPAAAPDVHLASGEPLTLVTTLSSGLDYVYAYTATGLEADGVPAAVLVSLADPAGNAAADVPAGTVVFDRTPPSLGSLVVSPAAARDGTLVQVSFVASEDLGADPVVVLSGATSVTLSKGAQVGRAYAYGHVAIPADGTALRALEIRLVDQAGLRATVTPGAQVTFDFTPPVVSGFAVCLHDGTAAPCATPRSTFSAAPPFDRMKVSFTLSEPIPGPAVTVGTTPLAVGGAPDGCATADGGTTWVCAHQVADAAGGGSPRVETSTVGAVATDAAGNTGAASGWVTLDFDPPALAGSPYLERCDGYAPARVGAADLWTKPVASYAGPGCPYAGATPGPVRVHFTVSEPVALGADGVYLDDGTPLAVDPVASTSTQLVAVLTRDAAEGSRTVRAHVLDASGNAQRLVLGTLRVDLTAPARPTTSSEGSVVYHRAPYGLDATGGATRYYLVGAAGAVASGASVVVYDGPDLATAGEIGRTTATSTGFGAAPGAAGAFEISAANVPELWVAQEDAAGNSSPPAVVWDGVWYATLGGKTRGVTLGNPNVFTEQPLWRASRGTTAQREPVDPTAVAVRAAAGLTTAGQPELRLLPKVAGAPAPRGGCRMTWDPDRGRGLLFAGGWGVYGSAPVYDDETWLWEGGSWQLQQVDLRPPGRMGHGLVHDVARGKTVLFGGCQGDSACATLLGDTWEHDGLGWRKVCWPGCTAPACTCTAMPAPRRDVAMFFDHLNGRAVLFGGEAAGGVLADTWTWDGTDWRLLAPAASPPARSRALVDSSPDDGSALLAAGLGAGGVALADVWRWDGTTWTGYAPAATLTPSGGSGYELWYDHVAQRYYALLVMGERLRAWNGSDWTDLGGATVTGSSTEWSLGRWGTCGTWDRERSTWVRFGGCLDYGTAGCRQDYAASQATWAFDGATVHQLAPGVAPGTRYGAGMTWFPAIGAARLTGGKATSRWSYLDTWAFDGLDWSGSGSAVDGGKYGFAMSAISDTKLVRLAGDGYGTSGAPVHTACDSGAGFSACWGGDMGGYDSTDPNTVDNVTFQAMAYDPPHGNAVYFRGDAGGTTWNAYWGVDYWPTTSGGPTSGVVWQLRTTTAAPSSVAGHQLLYCAGAGGVILFGGWNGASYLDETWLWTGGDWSRRWPATSPPARRGHVMLCDQDRGKLYVVGGQNASGHLADVWEYDGVTWRARTPIEAPGARREAVATWLPTSGRGVLFSGWDGAEYFGDTWLWNGGRDERPAHVLRAAFGAAGVWSESLVRGIDLTWWAGGTAATGGNGARLHVWDRGRWRPTSAANASATPGALTWSTSSAPEWSGYGQATLAERVKRLFAGDAQELTFAAAPVGTNGTSTSLATIQTDYAQVAVRYRLTCRAAGTATRDPARCCSGSASSGRCL